MKTRGTSQSAYLNLCALIGLVAVGTVLTAFVVYSAGRTGTSKPARQQLFSGPSPQGNVTEAWVRRINGPAIMGTMLQQMRQGTFMLPDGLKPRQAMKIVIR
jgi:hypothetical protein